MMLVRPSRCCEASLYFMVLAELLDLNVSWCYAGSITVMFHIW